MAETEIKGIFASDVVIRSAIVRALDNIYNDPKQLDYVFRSLVEDELTAPVYGQKQVELAKEWFLNTNIPVFMAFNIDSQHIPCITISLQESVETEQTLGDVHYVPQELTAGDWPALSPPFTPVAYSPTSGIMVLPPGLMGDDIVAAGMYVVTRDGRRYQVTANLGDDEISLAPYSVGDFTKAVIKPATERYVTTIESTDFKETYQVGIHVMGEPAHLLFLHAIVKYALLKYKQDLLEARGFERSVLQSTDFRRNQEFDAEVVFSRYINITGFVRQYWSKDMKQTIAVTSSSFEVAAAENLIVGAVGSDSDADAVTDTGAAPGPDDAWSVIPIEE